MKLDEAHGHWRRERERLLSIQEWVDEGKPELPKSMRRAFERYARLNKVDAKHALKDLREELEKDAFLRMFSAFEAELRDAFSSWLRERCGTTSVPEDIGEALPAIDGVLRLAAALEPRFDRSRTGYVSRVRECRNRLAHGGFAAPIPYDLEEVHRRLAEVIVLFR